MILYHGTSVLAAEKIVRTGLLPRSQTGAIPLMLNMASEFHVYLTDCYPSLYAFRAAIRDGCGEGVIFEIDTSKLNAKSFQLDERILAEIGAKKDRMQDISETDRISIYRSDIAKGAFREFSPMITLKQAGSIAYAFRIPVEALRRAFLIPLPLLRPARFLACDEDIWLANHRIYAPRYWAALNWILGEPAKDWRRPWEREIYDWPPAQDRQGIGIFTFSGRHATMPATSRRVVVESAHDQKTRSGVPG